MKHCIIAVKERLQYRCVFCQYETEIGPVLTAFYEHFDAAKALVELGDINSLEQTKVSAFHRDWGFDWQYTKPQLCQSKQALYDYSEATGLSLLYIFEDGQWQTERFEERFLPTMVGSAA